MICDLISETKENISIFSDVISHAPMGCPYCNFLCSTIGKDTTSIFTCIFTYPCTLYRNSSNSTNQQSPFSWLLHTNEHQVPLCVCWLGERNHHQNKHAIFRAGRRRYAIVEVRSCLNRLFIQLSDVGWINTHVKCPNRQRTCVSAVVGWIRSGERRWKWHWQRFDRWRWRPFPGVYLSRYMELSWRN